MQYDSKGYISYIHQKLAALVLEKQCYDDKFYHYQFNDT
jgi:hypothetical protein